MSTTWIAVANASIARIYVNHGPNKGLQLVKELAHPESREKGADLVSDRPGHNAGAGNGHGSFVPATDPKQNEAEHFALELAKELEHGRTTNSYQRLILVLSTPFMGMVKQRLSSHANSLVTDTIEKDYTRATEKELAGHLAHSIFL
jgi:protein required for attachment to host cells